MNDILRLLERQAAWQRSRAALSWSEKVRMSEAIRQSVVQFRRVESRSTSGDSTSSSSPGQTPTVKSPSAE